MYVAEPHHSHFASAFSQDSRLPGDPEGVELLFAIRGRTPVTTVAAAVSHKQRRWGVSMDKPTESETNSSPRTRAVSPVDEAEPGSTERAAVEYWAGRMEKSRCQLSERIFGDVSTKRTMVDA